MPTYTYRCPVHGEREVVKRMDYAGHEEYCWDCLGAINTKVDPQAVIPAPMRRIYNPQRIIIRPRGYNLRPGEYASNGLGYSHFDYELERGELRDDSAGVYTPESRAKREAEIAATDVYQARPMAEIDREIPHRAHQELHEWARVVHQQVSEDA